MGATVAVGGGADVAVGVAEPPQAAKAVMATTAIIMTTMYRAMFTFRMGETRPDFSHSRASALAGLTRDLGTRLANVIMGLQRKKLERHTDSVIP